MTAKRCQVSAYASFLRERALKRRVRFAKGGWPRPRPSARAGPMPDLTGLE